MHGQFRDSVFPKSSYGECWAGSCTLYQESMVAEAFIGVLFGPGNNGGDGLVVARTLSAWGYQVKAVTPFGESALGQACREQARLCEALGISTIYETSPPSSVADQVEVWVDALFGTGLKRPVEGVCQAWVEQLNEQEILIVSLIPSGVWGKWRRDQQNIAVQADHTISFQHSKWAYRAFPGADYRGRLHVRDIGIPRDAFGERKSRSELFGSVHTRPNPQTPKSQHTQGAFGTPGAYRWACWDVWGNKARSKG